MLAELITGTGTDYRQHPEMTTGTYRYSLPPSTGNDYRPKGYLNVAPNGVSNGAARASRDAGRGKFPTSKSRSQNHPPAPEGSGGARKLAPPKTGAEEMGS